MKTYRSSSPRETKEFGKAFAKRARARGSRPSGSPRGAFTIALSGALGAGKTTFVQGFLEGLNAGGRGTSPTFIIMRRHPLLRRDGSVFHIDAYRLKTPADLAALGFHEIAADPDNIILIEWAENVKRLLPKNTMWLRFSHGKKENERRIAATREL